MIGFMHAMIDQGIDNLVYRNLRSHLLSADMTRHDAGARVPDRPCLLASCADKTDACKAIDLWLILQGLLQVASLLWRLLDCSPCWDLTPPTHTKHLDSCCCVQTTPSSARTLGKFVARRLIQEAYWFRCATEYSRLLDDISMDIVLKHEHNTVGMCIAVSTILALVSVYRSLTLSKIPGEMLISIHTHRSGSGPGCSGLK
jgi:hypothetical protein